MFIAIEGAEDPKRMTEVHQKREEVAERLWRIAAVEQNVFNKTAFIDL